MSTGELLNGLTAAVVLIGFAVIGVGYYKAKSGADTESHLRSEVGDASDTIARLRGDVGDLRDDMKRAGERATAQDLVIAGLRAEVGVLQRSAEGATGPLRVMSDLMRDMMREMMTAVLELTGTVKAHRDVAEPGLAEIGRQTGEILDEVRTDEAGHG